MRRNLQIAPFDSVTPAPSDRATGAGVDAPPLDETWNLDDLYVDLDDFDRARERIAADLPGLDALRDTLDRSGGHLADALDRIHAAARELQRLHAYASMRSDVDMRVAVDQARRQETELLWNEFATRSSWLRPEILAMDPGHVRGLLDEEPRLAPYAFFLKDLLRVREHVLSPPEEKILADAGLVTGGPHAVFGVFHNAEMPRPEVELSDGETVRLTPAEFSRRRTTPNRDDRLRLTTGYFEGYVPYRETLGTNLYATIKAHVFRSRARGHASCLHAALDGDAVPVAVYHNLVEQVREHLPVLHRYLGLRARALGLDRPGYHDLHCPVAPDYRRSFKPAEGADLVRRSMEPLGDAYGAALDRCFGERWIDWHPTPGKRSGAYSAGSAYDVHPYILMNFTSDYESVSTLTHEVGHALHSHFSNAAQPFPTADYSIFVAEVASTFNEALLNRRMLAEAATDQERLFLLGTYLDQMRATMFRQTMFAEFERDIHARAEEGRALTGEWLSERYLEILRAHHGHAEGVMEIPDLYGIEWAGVPHFYYDFYVYQYATGIIASTALSEAVLAGGEDGARARARYLTFLSSGGSDHPLELLRAAGVDLETPEPYRRAMAAIGRALDRMDQLLTRLGR
jgi:oligoendopeptidase F